MRKREKRVETQDELVVAIGLVWGHLNARQFEEAYSLAKGCLKIWPDDRALVLMSSYAAAEMLEPVDQDKLQTVRDAASEGWVRLVLRRAAALVGYPSSKTHESRGDQ
jgi:hypothetical protein